ncbi:hypothetical protein QUF58_09730 [Anaerolineales bacterium HSG24]|nr:hypothetical protein [Anaerolineales bacterium HSG24]
MIVVSNSSPLIALSSINRLDILAHLFTAIHIPASVYQETVIENPIPEQQQRITQATQTFIQVVSPTIQQQFTRKLGAGEQGALNLAIEVDANFIILDDKKARREAKELGLMPIFTADILKLAEQQQYIASYHALVVQLAQRQIYIPE